jgi:hypothetical protein
MTNARPYLALSNVAAGEFPIAPNATPTARPSETKWMSKKVSFTLSEIVCGFYC